MILLNKEIARITDRIRQRSSSSRKAYLDRMKQFIPGLPCRHQLPESNLFHCFSQSNAEEIKLVASKDSPAIGIISASSDLLSEHALLQSYIKTIKSESIRNNALAQYVTGVISMSSYVTKGRPGMELTLHSRDISAMTTVLALSHQLYDGITLLAASDRSVSGMLIGALSFGYLPAGFISSGPSASLEGCKAPSDLMRRSIAEEASSPGYYTPEVERQIEKFHRIGGHNVFNGTNTCQMLMEFMGLHLPGMSFVSPETPLREVLTQEATRRVLASTAQSDNYRPLSQILDERSIVNAIVGLVSTGGSTDFSIDLAAIARAAGIIITWDDIDEIAQQVPLLARIFPNGDGELAEFNLAGGTAFLINELIQAGLLHEDVETVFGTGLLAYCYEPCLKDGQLLWRACAERSYDLASLRPTIEPFRDKGTVRLLTGNLGRGLIKVFDLDVERHQQELPAKVYTCPEQIYADFKQGKFKHDCCVVLIHQGIRAAGMPEHIPLVPLLYTLSLQGLNLALLTDGRESFNIRNVAVVTQLSPEASFGGALAKIQNGDLIKIDCQAGSLELDVSEAILAKRAALVPEINHADDLIGSELFLNFRQQCSLPEQGALSILNPLSEYPLIGDLKLTDSLVDHAANVQA